MFKKMLDFMRALLIRTRESGQAQTEPCLSPNMTEAIARWARLYDTGGERFGRESVHCIGLPQAIASEFARLMCAELKVVFDGGARASAMKEWTKTLFAGLRAAAEYGCAMGGLVIKPYVNGSNVQFDMIHADGFAPLAFDGAGHITAAVFAQQLHKGKYIYTRLERHDCVSGRYTVENRAFVSTNDAQLGRTIELTSVPEWEDLAPVVTLEGIDKPLFGYFRVPFANQIDRTSPLGVSVYSRAETLIQDADEQYGRFLWEYEGGELAVDAAEDYLKTAQDGTARLPTAF